MRADIQKVLSTLAATERQIAVRSLLRRTITSSALLTNLPRVSVEGWMHMLVHKHSNSHGRWPRENRAELLALAFHELAANALKYGSLASSTWQLSVTWSVKESVDGCTLKIDWIENGVFVMTRPARRGFYMEIIERNLVYELPAVAKMEFSKNGIRCVLNDAALVPSMSTIRNRQ